MKTAKKLCLWAWCLMAVALLATACGDAKVTMPPGPDGDRGNDGLTAYHLWKEALKQGTVTDWDANKDTEADFAKYLQGRDGADGTNGKDGKDGESAYAMWKRMVETGQVDDPHNKGQKWPATKTTVQDFWKFLTGGTGESGQVPSISDDGYWVVGGVKTKYKARGNKGAAGKDADAPLVEIENGMWKINGVVTNHRAEATDGTNGTNGTSPTLTINDQGMWVINGNPTTTRAKAQDGSDVEITISDGGNWFINGNDSGIKAFGEKGDPGIDGQDGKSAFQLWQEYIKGGKVNNPHNPKEKWPETKNTEADFWEFLSGYNEVEVEKNTGYVIRPLRMGTSVIDGQTHEEYHDRTWGRAYYRLFKDGKPVGKGYEVSQVVGLKKNWSDEPADAGTKFVTDQDGVFYVPASYLPNHKPEAERKGAAKVKAPNSETLVDSKPMTLLNSINVRLKITKVWMDFAGSPPHVHILAEMEREIEDGKWTKTFPVSENVPWPEVQGFYEVFKIIDPKQPVSPSNLQGIGKIKPNQSRQQRRWYDHEPFMYDEEEQTPVSVVRPYILHENEKGYQTDNTTKMNTFINNVYMYHAEENQEAYVGISTTQEYGRYWTAEEMIFVPEIYPAPDLLPSTLKIDASNPESLVLYGEFDRSTIKPFYLTTGSARGEYDSAQRTHSIGRRYTPEQTYFVKQGNVWIPNPANGGNEKGRFEGSNYWDKASYVANFGLKAAGAGAQNRSKTKYLREQNLKFSLPNLKVGREIDLEAILDSPDSWEWRSRKAWVLKQKDDGTYYLQSYYKDDVTIDLKTEPMPKDYLDKPSEVQPPVGTPAQP